MQDSKPSIKQQSKCVIKIEQGQRREYNQIQQQRYQQKEGTFRNMDQQSQWSLSSLQDLKRMQLNIQQHQQPSHNFESNITGKSSMSQRFYGEQKQYPPKVEINSNSIIKKLGDVRQVLGDLYIVESIVFDRIVNLDSWLYDDNRKARGYIIDVIGRVDHPYYVVKMDERLADIEEMQEDIPQLGQVVQPQINLQRIWKEVFFIQGFNILTANDMKNQQSIPKDEENEQSSNDSEDQDPKTNNYKRSNKKQDSRQRTRDQKQHQFWMKNGYKNQQYLQHMYRQHYQQMMQMYNPNYIKSNYLNRASKQQYQNYHNQQTSNQMERMPFHMQHTANSIQNIPKQIYQKTNIAQGYQCQQKKQQYIRIKETETKNYMKPSQRHVQANMGITKNTGDQRSANQLSMLYGLPKNVEGTKKQLQKGNNAQKN